MRLPGVGKPTLYRYFPSKDALFLAVFVEALDDLESRLDKVMSTTQGAETRLRGLLCEMMPTFRHHLVALRLGGSPDATADQSKRRVFRERRARLAAFLADALADGAAYGELRCTSTEMVAQFMIGMIRSAAANTDASDAEIVNQICDIVLNGILPHGGPRENDTPSRPRRRSPRRSGNEA